MDDVQNTPSLQLEGGASLRKEIGLVTPSQLANALGVSEVTLQVWRQKGNGPRFTKLGKNIFYPVREIQHWTELNVLDRVRESLPTEAPMVHYKSGKVVEILDATPQQAHDQTQTYGDPSSADEIDEALTKLIDPLQITSTPSGPST